MGGGHPLIKKFTKKEFANMMAFLKEKVRKSWKMYLVNPWVNILLKARLVIGLLEKYLPMFNIFSFKYFQINSFWHVVIWVNYQQDLTVVRIFGSAVFLQKSEQWHSQLKQILRWYFSWKITKKDHTFYDISFGTLPLPSTRS